MELSPEDLPLLVAALDRMRALTRHGMARLLAQAGD
jgi:hypothetical protein